MLWPVLVIDRNFTIQYWNALALKLLGTTESLQGQKLAQWLPEQAMLQPVQESIQTGSPRKGSYSKDATGTAWNISVTPLEHIPAELAPLHGAALAEQEQQCFTYFVVSIEDCSELRRLERVRRDFIANVSHELRTPLASVRLLAETLEEAIDTDHDKAQVFLEKIETEVLHLNALVSELLELSSIESGLVPMVIEPVEAGQLVREVMARMLPQAQRHRVMLRTEIQEEHTLVAA